MHPFNNNDLSFSMDISREEWLWSKALKFLVYLTTNHDSNNFLCFLDDFPALILIKSLSKKYIYHAIPIVFI